MRRTIFILSLLLNGCLIASAVYYVYRNPARFYAFLGSSKSEKSGFGPYYDQRIGLFNILHHDTADILFVGHSIIDGCEWSELFGDTRVKNRGINGEVIAGLFNQTEILSSPSPKKIFLMMGTNDIGQFENTDGIAVRMGEFVRLFKRKNPHTQIYLLGLLPVNRDMDEVTVKNAKSYERALAQLAAEEHCYYVELASEFTDKEGYFDTAYTNDGWHLTGKGYLKMKDILLPLIR